jgi:hypothetical protein
MCCGRFRSDVVETSHRKENPGVAREPHEGLNPGVRVGLETARYELPEEAGEVEKLRATMGEIQAVLDQQGDRDESLSERVAGSARRFEASHPVLTENLGRIADILQQMGI